MNALEAPRRSKLSAAPLSLRLPSPSAVSRWQRLVSCVLSVMVLSLHARMTLHPISPSLATAMQMDARQIQFDAPVSVVPRVPTLLYPHMIGARLMSFPLFQRRWRQFASSATKAGVTAADAVRMAISGWVPELSGTPYQHTPPREPQWTARDLAAMTTITSSCFSNSMIHLAAAMSL